MFPMLANWLSPKPPLDEESVLWIFQVFGWALRNLDGTLFRDETILVTPTNEHFPGRASSVPEMAELILRQTADYAGMGHWPLRLLKADAVLSEPAMPLVVPGVPGGTGRLAIETAGPGAVVPVAYEPALVANPEALIAGFAQTLAHYLGSAVRELPPGGLQNWPQATEVLAVFLGFGLMLANTAFQFQARSCGSCSGPAPQRQAYLSQYDITYALALFCALKDIPNRNALDHLKRPLRGYFKRCSDDIAARNRELRRLRLLA